MNNKQVSINCAERRTPENKPLQIGKIGYTQKSLPAIFLHCRGHSARGHNVFHAQPLHQMLRTWRQLANGDVQAMRNYIDVLKRGLLEAEADMQIMTDAIIIADKTEEGA